MKHIISILLLLSPLIYPSMAQTEPDRQEFVIKKQRIIDNEQIFTASEVQQLGRIIEHVWEKGIAEIAIVTIDDRHTDSENFDRYVYENLTSYALGEYGKNNGVVIAVSKKLRQIRVENGYGIGKVLSDQATKAIIDEQFIPHFKEGDYFTGTLNGLNAIVSVLEQAMGQLDFIDVSSIFLPSFFRDIRIFVLENGTHRTFRHLDRNNPSYSFTSLDVFFGPSRSNAYLIRDFHYDDYYEMVIQDVKGDYYQFVYFEEPIADQTVIHENMQPGKVYRWHPGDKFLSSDVWPLLDQMESEMAQNSAVKDAKPFVEYRWVLKEKLCPMEGIGMDVDNNDTLSFGGSNLFVNGRNTGSFDVKPEERLLSLAISDGEEESFAVFQIDSQYGYRYVFNKQEGKLYLIPLDKTGGDDPICVGGCTLVFERVEE